MRGAIKTARKRAPHKKNSRKGHFVYSCCNCKKKCNVDELRESKDGFMPAYMISQKNTHLKFHMGYMWHGIDFICIDCHRELVINAEKDENGLPVFKKG